MRNHTFAVAAFCLFCCALASAGPRETALQQMPIVFRPAVFTGEQFPKADFEYPDVVKAAVGDYQIRTTYYDVDQNEVKSAAKPGRYGAVVEIIAADGAKGQRFVTLYRRPGSGRIQWQTMNVGAVNLPADLGIDPAVAAEQGRHVTTLFRDLAGNATMQPGNLAAALAGLSEMKAGDGAAPDRLGPVQRDREWWYSLRKKLGEPGGYRHWASLPPDYDKDPAKKWPVLVFLHGSGERGDDLERVKVHGPHKYWAGRQEQPFVMIYPQCPSGQWWTPVALNDLLDEALAKYRIDPDRVYLTGLSLGGYGSWDWSMRNPERFAALVPICGRGDAMDAARVKDIPTWVFHGLKDWTVPAQYSIDLIESLAKVSGRVRFTFYSEAGHDSWTESYNNPALYSWLLSQRRGAPEQPQMTALPNLPKP